MSDNVKKNTLISGMAPGYLMLRESATAQDKSKKYVFVGCFTQCSSRKPGGKIVKNRNNRIYYDEEVLRHLGYLRDQIQENGFLAGELDHPDRFEVKLSEASHKITDLWYEPETQRVMGKLELLDTPKGQIAKQLVDAGLKLAVSSRSAGSVRVDSSVELDMMYTWDIVFTPGFKEAHPDRIMESIITDPETRRLLNESLSADRTQDVFVLDADAKINKKAMKLMNDPIDLKMLTKPLCESDDEEKKDGETAEVTLPEANINPLEEDGADDGNDDKEKKAGKDDAEKEDAGKDKNLTDDDKKKRRDLIVGITAQGKDEKTSASGKDAESNREDIISIEGVESTEDDGKEDAGKDKEDDKADKKPAVKPEDGDEVDECGDVEECGDNCKNGECDDDCDEGDLPTDAKTKKTKASNKELNNKILTDCDQKCKDVKKKADDDMDRIKKLLDKAAERKKVKESIYRYYPFTVSLSESNFGKFAALSVKDKNKVQKFIVENEIFSVQDINEHWMTPLREERRQLKNWLRLASEEDRRLFSQAPADVQDAIEESSKYVLIRNKQEADEFWEKTGLRQQNAVRIMNESFSQRYSLQKNEDADDSSYTAQKARELGYPVDYFRMLEEMYN